MKETFCHLISNPEHIGYRGWSLLRPGSRSYDQPTSVDVSFDPPATSGWGSTANESTGGGWDTVTSEKAGNGWDSVATEKPAGRWDTVVAGAAGGQSHQSEDTGVRWGHCSHQ